MKSTAAVAVAVIKKTGKIAWRSQATGNGSYAHPIIVDAQVIAGGKLLVAGGLSGTTELATAELFDPATGSWSSAGRMSATPGIGFGI